MMTILVIADIKGRLGGELSSAARDSYPGIKVKFAGRPGQVEAHTRPAMLVAAPESQKELTELAAYWTREGKPPLVLVVPELAPEWTKPAHNLHPRLLLDQSEAGRLIGPVLKSMAANLAGPVGQKTGSLR